MSVSREDNYTGVFDGKVGFGRNPAVVVVYLNHANTTRLVRAQGAGTTQSSTW